MIVAYLDHTVDLMEGMYRAFLAKALIEKSPSIDEPVKCWASSSKDLELDSKNRFIIINGGQIFRYDILWIGSLATFYYCDVHYRHLGPEKLTQTVKQFSWEYDGEILNLFLFPWQKFPVLPGVII